jgi:hypothetical protein
MSVDPDSLASRTGTCDPKDLEMFDMEEEERQSFDMGEKAEVDEKIQELYSV